MPQEQGAAAGGAVRGALKELRVQRHAGRAVRFAVGKHRTAGRVDRQHIGSGARCARIDLAPAELQRGGHRRGHRDADGAFQLARAAKIGIGSNGDGQRNLIAGRGACAHGHAGGCAGDGAQGRRDLGGAGVRHHIAGLGDGGDHAGGIAREGDVLIGQKHHGGILARRARAARRAGSAVLHLVDAGRVADAAVRGRDAQRGGRAHEDGVGGLHHQCGCGDAGIVAGGRIIRPGAAAVFVLPLAHGHVLQIRCQRDLGGRHIAVLVVLEHLLTADPRRLRVFAGGDQREGDVRRGVDGQAGIRVSVGHISDVGQQTAGNRGELVLADRQHIAGHGFTAGKVGFGAGAFPALPGDGQCGIGQRDGGLVGVHHRGDDQLARRGGPVGLIGVGVHIVDLGAGLIGAEVGRQAFAVRQVDDGFGAGCDNRHGQSSLSVSSQE